MGYNLGKNIFCFLKGVAILKLSKSILITGVVLVLVLSLIGCSGIVKNKEVANVNGEKITVQELEFYLQSVKGEMEAEARANNENVDKYWETVEAINLARQKALEAAVISKVQVLKAKELGLSLDDSDSKAVTDTKKKYLEEAGGKEKYLAELKSKGLNDKIFTDILMNSKLIEKLFQKISAGNDKYNVSEEEVNKYYNDNYDLFKSQPMVRAKHILVMTADQNRQPLPQEKQDEAKKKMDDILARIKKGESFDVLMNEFTEDPGLAQSPDGYTFEKNGQMVPEFEAAAFSLNKGEVSDVVKTDFGYHIIKVEDKFDHYPLEQIGEQVKQRIVRLRFEEQAKEWKTGYTVQTDDAVLKNLNVK